MLGFVLRGDAMKKEYQKIVKEVMDTHEGKAMWLSEAVILTAERCEALVDKPVRELTDAEMLAAYSDNYPHTSDGLRKALRAIIAAHIAKQSQPETRKVKYWTWADSNGELHHYNSDAEPTPCPDGWRLVDEFEREVTL